MCFLKLAVAAVSYAVVVGGRALGTGRIDGEYCSGWIENSMKLPSDIWGIPRPVMLPGDFCEFDGSC